MQMTQIHGHEVIEMMMTSGKNYSASELILDVEKKYGAEVRFYTCSSENMSAAELVEFLDTKGKFIQKEDGFNFNPEKKCNH
jgi:probable metal-binding protein